MNNEFKSYPPESQGAILTFKRLCSDVNRSAAPRLRLLKLFAFVSVVQILIIGTVLVFGGLGSLFYDLLAGAMLVLYFAFLINMKRWKNLCITIAALNISVEEVFLFDVAAALGISRDRAVSFLPADADGGKVCFSHVYVMVMECMPRSNRKYKGVDDEK